jgi:hypothetical protein
MTNLILKLNTKLKISNFNIYIYMNNINPLYWGPPAWDFLFYCAVAYPDEPTGEDKQNIVIFLNMLKNILPCSTCRGNYQNHLQKYPLTDNDVSSRHNLINWLITIRNQVNATQNKPPITYEYIIDKYVNGISHNFFSRHHKIITILLILLLIILLICYLKSV